MDGIAPGRARGGNRRKPVGVEELPDVMTAICVPVRSREQVPVGGFAHIVVVEIAVLDLEAVGMVLISRLGVHAGLYRRSGVILRDQVVTVAVAGMSRLDHI